MDISKIGGGIAEIGKATGSSAPTSGPGSFADILKNLAGSAVQDQKQAEALTTAVANGDTTVPLQDVIQAVSKAELTLQTLVTIRDKAVEAYQEIARMPI